MWRPTHMSSTSTRKSPFRLSISRAWTFPPSNSRRRRLIVLSVASFSAVTPLTKSAHFFGLPNKRIVLEWRSAFCIVKTRDGDRLASQGVVRKNSELLLADYGHLPGQYVTTCRLGCSNSFQNWSLLSPTTFGWNLSACCTPWFDISC